MELQLASLFKETDRLQKIYGNPTLFPTYGAGCTKRPKLVLLFMNPTAKNISVQPNWNGLHAPWLGTKNVWKMLNKSNFLTNITYNTILNLKPNEWIPEFCHNLYSEIANKGIYITNHAKCTQDTAKAISNTVFQEYLALLKEEIEILAPQHIVAFGNQVSSVVLQKGISVSQYSGLQFEPLIINAKEFRVYPTYYPVGQGMRNMPFAIQRIQDVFED